MNPSKCELFLSILFLEHRSLATLSVIPSDSDQIVNLREICYLYARLPGEGLQSRSHLCYQAGKSKEYSPYPEFIYDSGPAVISELNSAAAIAVEVADVNPVFTIPYA